MTATNPPLSWLVILLTALLVGGNTEALAAPGLGQISLSSAHVVYVPGNSGEIIAVMTMFNSDPDDVVHNLPQLFSVKIAYDPASYHVIMRGQPEAVAQAVSVIRHLEETKVYHEPIVVLVIRLKNSHALNVAATLQRMQERSFFNGFHPVTCVGDTRTNSVVVACGRVCEQRIRNIIAELDRSLIPSTQPAPEIRIDRTGLSPDTQP
jgi:hypothetical protein